MPGLLAGQLRRAWRNAGLGAAAMTVVSLGLARLVPLLLERENEGYALTPLSQTGPVLINGVQAQKTMLLQPGDVIAVGQAQITFHTKEVWGY